MPAPAATPAATRTAPGTSASPIRSAPSSSAALIAPNGTSAEQPHPVSAQPRERAVQQVEAARADRHGQVADGRAVTLWVLNHVAPDLGWRVAYLVGPVLALVIIYVRRSLPESPRRQIMHGQEQAAAMILGGVVAIFFGVNAEGKSLEDVATPLSVIAKPAQTIFRSGDHPEGLAPSAGD